MIGKESRLSSTHTHTHTYLCALRFPKTTRFQTILFVKEKRVFINQSIQRKLSQDRCSVLDIKKTENREIWRHYLVTSLIFTSSPFFFVFVIWQIYVVSTTAIIPPPPFERIEHHGQEYHITYADTHTGHEGRRGERVVMGGMAAAVEKWIDIQTRQRHRLIGGSQGA